MDEPLGLQDNRHWNLGPPRCRSIDIVYVDVSIGPGPILLGGPWAVSYQTSATDSSGCQNFVSNDSWRATLVVPPSIKSGTYYVAAGCRQNQAVPGSYTPAKI